MVRRARAKSEDAQEPAPIADAVEQVLTTVTPEVATAPEGEQNGQKKYADKVDPHGVHTIALIPGLKMRLLRSDKMQQSRIMFLAEEGIDPRPPEEDKEFMKSRGFHWRSRDLAWERQFFNAEQKAEINEALNENDELKVRQLRSKYRIESDRIGQDTFVELANRIRERNGLEPIDYSFGQERTPL